MTQSQSELRLRKIKTVKRIAKRGINSELYGINHCEMLIIIKKTNLHKLAKLATAKGIELLSVCFKVRRLTAELCGKTLYLSFKIK